MNIEELLQLINRVSASTLTAFQYEENGMVLSMKKEPVTLTSCNSVDLPKQTVEMIQYTDDAVTQEIGRAHV